MKVKDVMTTPALSVSEYTDVFHISKLMKENDIGVIPVCAKNGEIKGIVTDRDIVLRVLGEGRTTDSVLAKEIMTAQVTAVSPMTDLDDAFSIMSEIKVRRLPVVSDKKLVGMVTLGDLSQSLDYSVEIADALCEVCHGCEKNWLFLKIYCYFWKIMLYWI